jgi:transcriptional regulator with XRE-family HTH domain
MALKTPQATKAFSKRFPTRDSVAVETLAANLRKLRKARDWSQAELANRIDVEQNAISLIENGRANPTLLVIEQIALAFDIRLSELLETATRPRSKA